MLFIVFQKHLVFFFDILYFECAIDMVEILFAREKVPWNVSKNKPVGKTTVA